MPRIVENGIAWCDCPVLQRTDILPGIGERHVDCNSWIWVDPQQAKNWSITQSLKRPKDRGIPITMGAGKCLHSSVIRHAWPDGTYEDRCADMCKVILVARNAPHLAPVLVAPILKTWNERILGQAKGEFEGFCTPCGGLRRHKLGCPTTRGA